MLRAESKEPGTGTVKLPVTEFRSRCYCKPLSSVFPRVTGRPEFRIAIGKNMFQKLLRLPSRLLKAQYISICRLNRVNHLITTAITPVQIVGGYTNSLVLASAASTYARNKNVTDFFIRVRAHAKLTPTPELFPLVDRDSDTVILTTPALVS